MKLDRRELLTLGSGLLAGCALPSRPGPEIQHPRYPLVDVGHRSASPGKIWVGTATVDLTPEADARYYLAGHFPHRMGAGIRDPIRARTAFFDDGVTRVALVSADLFGLSLASTQRIRQLVAGDVSIVVCTTHTHSAPDTLGLWGPTMLGVVPSKSGVDPAYLQRVERSVAISVELAARRAQPCTLWSARGSAPIEAMQDGDDALTVLEARLEKGAPVVTLVRFGCTPDALGRHSSLVSADFPGGVCDFVSARRGGGCLFLNGSSAGVYPKFDDPQDEGARDGALEGLSRKAADAVERALTKAEPGPARLQFERGLVRLEVRDPRFVRAVERGLRERSERGWPDYVFTEVSRVRLGAWSLGFLPGAPTVRASRELGSGLEMVGPACDHLGLVLAEQDEPVDVSDALFPRALPALKAAFEAFTDPKPELRLDEARG